VSGVLRAALARSASLFGLWVVLIGVYPADVLVGIPVAAAAAWSSLRLLPPQPEVVRLLALPRLALRFVWQSLVAGFDVARRALDPRLPLRTGFTRCAVGFPPGPLRGAFVALTCLLPGTVAVVDDGDTLLYHCLDLDQPVAAQLAAEEAVVRQALRGTQP
jgi:multicomponent Na+:H+ antiporter subunit E